MSSFNFDASVKSLDGWEEGRPNSEDIMRLKGMCTAEGFPSYKECFDEGSGSFVNSIQGLEPLSEDEEDDDDDDDELSRMEAGTRRGGGKRKKSRRGKSKGRKSKRHKSKRKSKRSKSRRGKSRRGKSRRGKSRRSKSRI